MEKGTILYLKKLAYVVFFNNNRSINIFSKKNSIFLHLFSILYGYQLSLRLTGIGFSANIINNNVLSLKIGFSNIINTEIPNTILTKIKNDEKKKTEYCLIFCK